MAPKPHTLVNTKIDDGDRRDACPTQAGPDLGSFSTAWIRFRKTRPMCAGLKTRSSVRPKFMRNTKQRRATVMCFDFIARGWRRGPTLGWRSRSPWNCRAGSVRIFLQSVMQDQNPARRGVTTPIATGLRFFSIPPTPATRHAHNCLFGADRCLNLIPQGVFSRALFCLAVRAETK